MTYHPIDKPTEPGWYWFRVDSPIAEPYPVCVRYEANQLVADGLMPPNPGTPFTAQLDKFVGDWHGPAIQPPKKYEARMAPEAPRRFRWVRRSPPGREETGYGLLIYMDGSAIYYTCDKFNINGTLGALKQSGYEITEWLDQPATDGQTQGTVR